MSCYNGATNNRKKSVNTKGLHGKSCVENTQENSSLERLFRGFEKLPTVVLQRADITPYLYKKVDRNTHLEELKISADNPVNIERFLAKCSVNVLRHDLEKLKATYFECRNRPSIEMVDLDASMFLKCKICEKSYSSERKLQNHHENKHMLVYKPSIPKTPKRVSFSDKVIVHEVKEYHKCRKCTKIFENYKSLKAHMKQRHKKRKCYICNYCTKRFVDRMFFKVHIKLHCDICGILLPNKTTYLSHRRNVCRVLKIHKCKTCDISFFKFMDLKDHSYEHSDTYFVCDICKDQCPSKCAVAHHISFLHSSQRPTSLYTMRNIGTERLYLCNFCDESSVDRDLIEAHVQLLPDLNNRAMTGYKDFYFCDQCLEKFDTEKDMLQHKWTHFLKTSDNSQTRPKGILTNNKEIRTIYNVNEKIPDYLQPKVILEKLKIDGRILTNKEPIDFIDVNSFDISNGNIKRAVVDPKSKKTLISKHQCETCGKYYSTNYCLTRHIETQHGDYENLRCGVCEETFVWPSLLRTHKCIRLNLPERNFEDARPEIYFDNVHAITVNGFDDLNITENEDYMNSVDFEIPAPIVELSESEGRFVNSDSGVLIQNNGQNGRCDMSRFSNDNQFQVDASKLLPLHHLGYKVVMQEVPIEF